MSVTVEEIADEAGFAELEPSWRCLHQRARATPFQSWEWMSSWWRHLRADALWILIARDRDELIAILPLCRSRLRGLPLRRVSFLATPISDYHGMLVEGARAAECRDAFLAHLIAERDRWDLVDLPDLAGGSALAELPALAGMRARLFPHRVCPVIALRPSWEEQRADLGKSLRARLGQKRRQLERDFQLELDVVEAPELDVALEELFWLHNRRWRRRGLKGAFSSERIRQFHHEVAPRFLERGWLKLYRLRLDGKTRALFYCFAHEGRVYYYLSGFDLALARYSPGTVLMAHAVGEAIAEGASEFDLLRGDENYKKPWRSTERSTFRLVIGKPRSLRSRAALGIIWLERRLEATGAELRNRLWGHRTARVG